MDTQRHATKVAIVTGAGSGIGLATAVRLAREGATIVASDINAAGLDEAQRLIAAAGAEATGVLADIGLQADVDRLVDDTVRRHGRVDILVNNAGIQNVQPIDEFSDEKWDDIIAVNLSSAFHTIKAAAPAMKKKGWGRVINIASVHGLVASKFKSAYVAAKHGMVGLTKAAALDLAEFGITVNAICPGYVDTPLVRGQIPQQMKEHNLSEKEVIEKVMLKNHAVKQFVEVGDLAALAVFLSSDAAVAMTGQALAMDGGWTAQ